MDTAVIEPSRPNTPPLNRCLRHLACARRMTERCSMRLLTAPSASPMQTNMPGSGWP